MKIYSYYDKKPRKVNLRARINFFLLIFLLFLAVIVVKLFSIQVINSEKYQYIAAKQSQSREVLYPPRGIIFDRNMNPLVTNVFNVSVIVDPFRLKSPDSIATVVSAVFGKPKENYLNILSGSPNSVVYLEKRASIEDLKGLDTLKIDGVNIIKEPARYYIYGSLAAQTIGFTNSENKGVTGVELYFNNELSGVEGYVINQKNAKEIKRPDLNYKQKDPIPGNNIVLTIDKNVQAIAEEELLKGINYYGSTSGRVVVMSVKTGEIIAMASYPFFNPNNIKPEDSTGIKNSVISDLYEPGSTFKLITASAALEEGIESPSNSVNTENGVYNFAGMTIKDSYPASGMSFQEVIEKSSNIGVSKIAEKIGQERFYKYARDFGFGILTGVELLGENKGLLKRPVDFTAGSLEFMSIGYQVSVNALQLSMAYGAVANRGVLMKPSILKKELSSLGNIVNEFKPVPVRQVISENTSRKLIEFFSGVVLRGTGTDAYCDRVKIAGKTGTTQRIVDGKYTSQSHISSFVGFFPAENPEILITVIIDDPKNGYYGGKVAAPVFKKITERLIDYAGIIENLNSEYFTKKLNSQSGSDFLVNASENNNIIVPDLTGLTLESAMEILNEKGLKSDINDIDKKNLKFQIVTFQNPEKGRFVSSGTIVSVKTSEANKNNEKMIVVPDITNLTLRKAINKLISEGFTIEVNGSGKIVDQYPRKGNTVIPKTKITIFCKNEI